MIAKELKQYKFCHQQREEMRAGLHVDCDACASAGKKSADMRARFLKKAYKDTDELLFKGMARVQMSDRGDNWNERWQEALSLPNGSNMERGYRRSSLDAVYSDFVHTAVTYGRTIISEYFLHEYMKSVKPKRLGGVAGGKKYLWRGILFKLADGSQGPYGGSDEAAAKAAGHELRGASEYLKTGVGLCVPPMCLLDYKGFRMLAQAHLPLGARSLKMGTDDGGKTVLNDSPALDEKAARAAKALGLRAHVVGGRQAWVAFRDAETGSVYKKKRNLGGQVLHAAADVEGHEGTDSRMYLLDLARAFPPEDPDATPHLSGMLSVSAKVIVRKEGQKAKAGTVTKAHDTLVDYDILYQDGTMEKATPAHLLRDLRLFIFYRLLRPEFVRDRGRAVLKRVNIPPDHKFPAVRMTNPMMFAMTNARRPVQGGDKEENAKGKTAATSSTAASRQRDRYAVVNADEDTITPSNAPPRRNNAYAKTNSGLASVSETHPYGEPSDPAPAAAYEPFNGGLEEGGDYDRAYSNGGGGVGMEERRLGGRRISTDRKAHEAWKLDAMECGVEFVSTGDEHSEGFEKSEVEEDEDELKLRGGIGYRQFREPDDDDDCYDVADLGGEDDASYDDDDDDDGDDDSTNELDGSGRVGGGNNDNHDDSLGIITRGTGSNAFGGVSRKEEEENYNGGARSEAVVAEEDIRFERGGMLRRHSTRGPKTAEDDSKEKNNAVAAAAAPTQAPQAPAAPEENAPNNPAGPPGRRAWSGNGTKSEKLTVAISSSSEDEDDGGVGGGVGGGLTGNNYTGFSTRSETSSMFSTGGAPVPTDKYISRAHVVRRPSLRYMNPAPSPASDFAPSTAARDGDGGGSGGQPRQGGGPVPSLSDSGRGYDTFCGASLNSQSPPEPGSPISNFHRITTNSGGGGNGNNSNNNNNNRAAVFVSPARRPGGAADHDHDNGDSVNINNGSGNGYDDDDHSRFPAATAAAAAAAAAAETEAFAPSAGYDKFSTKSLLSTASAGSLSDLSVPLPTTAFRGARLGGNATLNGGSRSDGGGGGGGVGVDQPTSKGGPGGGVGDGHGGGGGCDDDDSSGNDGLEGNNGYSSFVPPSGASCGSLTPASSCRGFNNGSNGSGRGSVLPRVHKRVTSVSSSTEGAFGGGGGSGGGSSSTNSSVANGQQQQQQQQQRYGPEDPADVPVKKNDRNNEGRKGTRDHRPNASSILWPAAKGEDTRRSVSPKAVVAADDGGDGDGDGDAGIGILGAGGVGSSVYDGFVERPVDGEIGDGGFNDHDADGDLPPPMSLAGASAYANFKTSDRSIASTSTVGRPQQEQKLPPPPPPPATSSPSLQPQALTGPQRKRPVDRKQQQQEQGEEEEEQEEQQQQARAPINAVPVHAAGDGEAKENGHGKGVAGDGEDESPTPLSPDALTAFSNGDPEAKERNREVTEATKLLVTVLVPATAKLLCSMPRHHLMKINLAQELHKYGVNVRHIGLLRAYVTPSKGGASSYAVSSSSSSSTGGAGKSSKTSAGIMRDRALVEVVVRTLKLVLRSFQRQWMKSEQSSSEQGMHMLVAQFLNLVTGQHERSRLFWHEYVTTGVCQRFGTVALTDSERAGLWTVCSDRPDLLLTMVKELVKVTGVRFKESVNKQLRSKSAKTVIVGFKFSLNDIRDIEAVVTPMAIYQS
ncbi:unnamed protein product [Pylaiella littoralis]